MPAKACVIGRFGYEDKYRDEPSFVIATFMRQRARRDVHAPTPSPLPASACAENAKSGNELFMCKLLLGLRRS
jgi:hypothetical protein